MYKSHAKHFTYGNIPGAGKGWTLDVCAMSRRDADDYIRNVHRGGKFVGQNVKAMCGAITSEAQKHLAEQLEIWMNEGE